MPKPPVNAKAKNAKKKGKKTASNFPKKLVLIGCFIVLISIFAILWKHRKFYIKGEIKNEQ